MGVRNRLDDIFVFASNRLKTTASRKESLLYYGWLGFRNLGDEALFEAIRMHFDEKFDFFFCWRFRENSAFG